MKTRAAAGLAAIGALTGLALALGIVTACSAAPDFAPYTCALSIDQAGDAGDAGEAGDANDDGGDSGDATLANGGTGGDAGGTGDAGAGPLPTAYFYARQITPEDCDVASVSWVQCDDGIYARYYAVTAVDGGALTIDYYQGATGAFIAQLLYPSVSSAGQCTAGPSAFTPPACGGTQLVCCPAPLDAGDAATASSDASPSADAAPDSGSGCGF